MPPAATPRRKKAENSTGLSPALSFSTKPHRSDSIHITESRGDGHSKSTHTFEVSQGSVTAISDSSQHASLARRLGSLFLPEGYPDSVTPDYLPFQMWDTVQAVCSYLRGILCVQAIMAGVGVGSAEATAVSAAIQWVLRDGAGMLGGMLFAWYNSQSFGSNVKFWRLFADVINDVGLTLELLSPTFPEYFLAIACVGSICRAMCGIAAGATRAALTHHFALRRNHGDISVKEGTQETAVNLIGMLSGIAVAKWLDASGQHKLAITWFVFSALTVIHVYANYKAIKSLVLKSINVERMELLVDDFINRSSQGSIPLQLSADSSNVLSPTRVANSESLCWSFLPSIAAYRYPAMVSATHTSTELSVLQRVIRLLWLLCLAPIRVLFFLLISISCRLLMVCVIGPVARIWYRQSSSLTLVLAKYGGIQMGASFDSFVGSRLDLLNWLHSIRCNEFSASKYLLDFDTSCDSRIRVLLHSTATIKHECQAFFHACVRVRLSEATSNADSLEFLHDIDRHIELFFEVFWNSLQLSGWDLNDISLQSGPDSGWKFD